MSTAVTYHLFPNESIAPLTCKLFQYWHMVTQPAVSDDKYEKPLQKVDCNNWFRGIASFCKSLMSWKQVAHHAFEDPNASPPIFSHVCILPFYSADTKFNFKSWRASQKDDMLLLQALARLKFHSLAGDFWFIANPCCWNVEMGAGQSWIAQRNRKTGRAETNNPKNQGKE